MRSQQPKSKLSDWSYANSPIGKATQMCSPAASPLSQCLGKPSNETIRPFAQTLQILSRNLKKPYAVHAVR
jgi:hypothetical protein